jgi:hypothetical protein
MSRKRLVAFWKLYIFILEVILCIWRRHMVWMAAVTITLTNSSILSTNVIASDLTVMTFFSVVSYGNMSARIADYSSGT